MIGLFLCVFFTVSLNRIDHQFVRFSWLVQLALYGYFLLNLNQFGVHLFWMLTLLIIFPCRSLVPVFLWTVFGHFFILNFLAKIFTSSCILDIFEQVVYFLRKIFFQLYLSIGNFVQKTVSLLQKVILTLLISLSVLMWKILMAFIIAIINSMDFDDFIFVSEWNVLNFPIFKAFQIYFRLPYNLLASVLFDYSNFAYQLS